MHTVTIFIGGSSDFATDEERERIDCPGVIRDGTCTSCERTPEAIADDGDDPLIPTRTTLIFTRRH